MEIKPAIRGISKRTERSRRLEPGEADVARRVRFPSSGAGRGRAGDGIRKGELLVADWGQVRANELVLPPQKTKTKRARTVPISSRPAPDPGHAPNKVPMARISTAPTPSSSAP